MTMMTGCKMQSFLQHETNYNYVPFLKLLTTQMGHRLSAEIKQLTIHHRNYQTKPASKNIKT